MRAFDLRLGTLKVRLSFVGFFPFLFFLFSDFFLSIFLLGGLFFAWNLVRAGIRGFLSFTLLGRCEVVTPGLTGKRNS